jgi:hypothetical protein
VIIGKNANTINAQKFDGLKKCFHLTVKIYFDEMARNAAKK